MVSFDMSLDYLTQLGGPLMSGDNRTLIGVASHVRYNFFAEYRKNPINKQIFMKIHYYFDWISEVTGLELPKCEAPTEPELSTWSLITEYFSIPSNWLMGWFEERNT